MLQPTNTNEKETQIEINLRENRNKKLQFLKAFEKNGGNATEAAKAINIERRTIYTWLDKDKEFQENYNAVKHSSDEQMMDMVEDKLSILAKEKNPIILMFLAKCKGKKRGYIEKTEQEITTTNKTINVEFVDGEEKEKKQVKKKIEVKQYQPECISDPF